MRIALQADPPESFDPKGDTSLAIVLEALARGYPVFYYHPSSISSDSGTIKAFVHVLSAPNSEQRLLKSEGSWQELTDFDVILVRQDPPYNMSYLTATYFLEQIASKVQVINHPKALRDFPEKILPPSLQRLMPPTLITSSLQLVQDFAAQHHHNIIVKPLYGNGGRGIFHVQPHDRNLAVILESLWAIEPIPVMVQTYLPAIRDGDKRILLIGGKVRGAINRLAGDSDHRSNLHVGGSAHPAELTTRDREICATLEPFLRNNHIVLAGIDIIGTHLTEINITSPTGFQECARFSGENLAGYFWDEVATTQGLSRAT